MEYHKIKSVSKVVEVKGRGLTDKVLNTMDTVANIVGGTLGPGGSPVLIERQEYGLPNVITKDGVTVFRSLGFTDPVAHCIMEAARDASVRTANEAGDGTTTATVLANAIIHNTMAFCQANPSVSPQKVVRVLQGLYRDVVEPTIASNATKVELEGETRDILYSVAKVSANGDEELANAVLQCYDIVGDNGNVTIAEISGPSRYEVESIDGYTMPVGYEDSCGRYYPNFINDAGSSQTKLENPLFFLYHGKVIDFQSLLPMLSQVNQNWEQSGGSHNVVIVATGFSDQALGHMAVNFPAPGTLNVFPLIVPMSPLSNGQQGFLEDLAAITGAKIFDPISAPPETAKVEELGMGVSLFECGRFRSNIIGKRDEVLILERVDILQKQLDSAESRLEASILQERIGKITGGIAKLKVIGSSSGELKERRDRAEDAVCAVRGALKHGAAPGGGWMLCRIVGALFDKAASLDEVERRILYSVLVPSLEAPIERLLSNLGYSQTEIENVFGDIFAAAVGSNVVFNGYTLKFEDAFAAGVYDSIPAVRESIKNSLSIATLLGTLGGAVVFPRDSEFERSEARDTAEFNRNAGINPADERA
jgi:chaperonin GroEL